METQATTNELVMRMEKDMRVKVIDEMIQHLKTLKASASVPEGPSLAGLNLEDAARAIIKDEGPRGTRELAQTMLARGITTNSKNFVATIYATLKASKDFQRVGSNWALAAKQKR